MDLCIPLQINKSTNTANDIDADLMTLNNFFVHFVKEIDIRRYDDDIRMLPTNNPFFFSIHYFTSILKNLQLFINKLIHINEMVFTKN